ncbi:response regulator, partial [Vibrio makurazakiensis]|uniref:response regulator n=1 Tax=Vibrio makurazakiensis TaxID=2910250 RepID=UPI003D0B43B4
LQQYIDFDDFIVISRASNDDNFKTLLSTNKVFRKLEWYRETKFSSSIDGDCTILFEPEHLIEFSHFNPLILDQIGAVLLTGIEADFSESVILLVGGKSKNFSIETKKTLKRFRPLIERAIIDIESKKQLEATVELRTKELQLAQYEAEKANRAKSEFLAMMSHEIRTPLNSIVGLFDILQQTKLTEEQFDILSKVEFSSELLSTIIGDILDISKIEAGSFSLHSDWIALRDTVTFVIEEQRKLAAKKDLQMNISIDIDESLHYYLDSTRVAQVFFNLIGNAIKFTDLGSVTVGVVANKCSLEISIEDTGIGITEENLSLLFSPFKQADSSITKRFGGTGLGLAITKHLVQLMDGTITVTSDVNLGTRFEIEIPTDTRLAVAMLNEEATVGFEGSFSKQLSVLVVEDNPTNQMVIKLLLSRMGHEVTLIDNGTDALNYVRCNQQSIDLIFMDVSMPGMDGMTTTQYIRREKITTPIVALTAHSTSNDKQQCMNSGMDAFVAKPVRANDLQKAINLVLI